MEKILWALNKMPKSEDKCLPVMSIENIKQAREFHKSFPQYSITPLAKLDGMAEGLGLGGLFVKDESYRFGDVYKRQRQSLHSRTRISIFMLRGMPG